MGANMLNGMVARSVSHVLDSDADCNIFGHMPVFKHEGHGRETRLRDGLIRGASAACNGSSMNR